MFLFLIFKYEKEGLGVLSIQLTEERKSCLLIKSLPQQVTKSTSALIPGVRTSCVATVKPKAAGNVCGYAAVSQKQVCTLGDGARGLNPPLSSASDCESELDVEPEDGTEQLPSPEKTWMDEGLLLMDKQRKPFFEMEVKML